MKRRGRTICGKEDLKLGRANDDEGDFGKHSVTNNE